ncbi:MAG: HAMP domain-containing protein [Nitrospirae bacterium]|nr:HAMP domain-containing protein [Nitrospirota bacterium]
MRKKLRFPIRFKILISLLFVVTGVVSTITYTMANLFHADKSTYIRDLTSVTAMQAAQETRALLIGYSEKLRVFARLMHDAQLEKAQKTKMITRMLEDFPDFVTVTLYVDRVEQATVYDAVTLKKLGLSILELTAYRSKNKLPLDSIQAGAVYVENSTTSEKLPCLTMAIAVRDGADQGPPAVASAVIRLDGLQRLASRSKVFEIFVIDARGNLLAHSDPRKVIQHAQASWIPEIKGLNAMNTIGTTLEYVENGVPVVGGFARAEFSGLLAGAQIPKSAAYLTARALLNNLVIIALILLVVSAIISLFWSQLITRPIEHLSRAANEVGKGRFDVRVQAASRDEIGDMAESFNQMAEGLDTREQELQASQAALIQSEKMAAFGQLGAGIAHEIKNPLAGIIGLAQLLLRKVDKDSPLYENLAMIEKEARRSKTITENLLRFARQEKMEFTKIDLNAVAMESAAIVDHQLGINQIRLKKELAPRLPQIIGNANQLQQVLMNLMINAQQAMEGSPGSVTLSTRLLDAETIELRVTDTGPGIPPDIQAKIFEPFFTTKTAGKGTGLGLSVSYGIIKDHKGDVRVESTVGKGSAFVITLPAAPASDAPQAPDDQAQRVH